MLSVSTTATWSRTAVIHARCDQYFWAFAAHFFFSTSSVAFNTPRPSGSPSRRTLPAIWFGA